MTRAKRTLTIVTIQGIELGMHKGLSVTLEHLLYGFAKYSKHNHVFIVANDSLRSHHGNIPVMTTETSTYSILGHVIFMLRAFIMMLRLHRKSKIDIVFARYPLSSLLTATLFRLLASRDTKIYYDIRSPWIEIMAERKRSQLFNWLKHPLYLAERFLFRFVHRFSYSNEKIQSHYSARIQFLRDKRCDLLVAEVDERFIKQVEEGPIRTLRDSYPFRIKLVTMSELVKMRELDFLIRATHYAKPMGIELHIIGGGPMQIHYEREIQHYRLNSVVFLMGRVPHSRVAQLLLGFDVGVCHLPTSFAFRFSSPVKIHEFAACGKPILATNVWGTRKLKEFYPFIWLYDNRETSYAEALRDLLRNFPTDTDLRAASLAYIQAFGTKRLVELYIDAFEEEAYQDV